MGRARDVLIPARVLLTVGHFVVTVLAAYGRDAAVSAGLAASASATTYAAAQASLTAALVIAFAAFAVHVGGLLFGGTMLRDGLSLFHAALRFPQV